MQALSNSVYATVVRRPDSQARVSAAAAVPSSLNPARSYGSRVTSGQNSVSPAAAPYSATSPPSNVAPKAAYGSGSS